jgi:hypothetical protein
MIIGICGHAGSGKDTVANYISQGWNFYHISFASPLKEACRVIFDWTSDHTDGKLKEIVDERWGISPRQAMQLIGTEFGQKILCDNCEMFKNKTGRSLWVKRALDGVDNRNVVISDVRFQHELDYIHSMNGVVIKIERETNNNSKHESENGIDNLNCDYEISNNDTMSMLYFIVNETMKHIITKYNVVIK